MLAQSSSRLSAPVETAGRVRVWLFISATVHTDLTAFLRRSAASSPWEVSRLSAYGMTRYPSHYRPAFAFSHILYPLGTEAFLTIGLEPLRAHPIRLAEFRDP